jgi:hypothetical protein
MPFETRFGFRKRRFTSNSAHISSQLTAISVVIQDLNVSEFLSTWSFSESEFKDKSNIVLETNLIRVFS